MVLTGYMEYGPDFVKQMNGIFAFGIMDPVKDCLVLFRDRLGVKPLFYTCFHDQVIFPLRSRDFSHIRVLRQNWIKRV